MKINRRDFLAATSAAGFAAGAGSKARGGTKTSGSGGGNAGGNGKGNGQGGGGGGGAPLPLLGVTIAGQVTAAAGLMALRRRRKNRMPA